MKIPSAILLYKLRLKAPLGVWGIFTMRNAALAQSIGRIFVC